MTEPVTDMLTRVQAANQRIGGVLLELLNRPEGTEQAAQLRKLGQHLGTLSAECLARAAEVDGRCIEPPARVIIDAQSSS